MNIIELLVSTTIVTLSYLIGRSLGVTFGMVGWFAGFIMGMMAFVCLNIWTGHGGASRQQGWNWTKIRGFFVFVALLAFGYSGGWLTENRESVPLTFLGVGLGIGAFMALCSIFGSIRQSRQKLLP